MSPRFVLQALLLLSLSIAFPALAQEDAGVGTTDEWGDDDEWGAAGEGAVLGDEPTPEASASDDEPAPVGATAPASAAPVDTPVDTPADTPVATPADTPTDTSADTPDDSTASEPGDAGKVADGFERRVGDPVPLTQREPLLPQLGLEVGIRYGLVGTGPTRFIDDIRFGAFDWLELRTALAPYPSSLMARAGIGSAQSPWGIFLVEGGLAHLDAGLRLVPDAGEAEVGVRAHVEGILAYQVAFLDRLSLYSAVHLRSRFSMLSNDDQHAFASTIQLSYDLLPYLAVSGGVGYAQTLFGTPVREVATNFVETDRPGMSHFLVRDDGETHSFTIPLALSYGRVENFDVDIFATTRVWPKLDIVFGAGVRWRWWFGRKPWEPAS